MLGFEKEGLRRPEPLVLTLEAEVTKDVDRDTDVVRDERLVGKGHERVKALEEGEEAGD